MMRKEDEELDKIAYGRQEQEHRPQQQQQQQQQQEHTQAVSRKSCCMMFAVCCSRYKRIGETSTTAVAAAAAALLYSPTKAIRIATTKPYQATVWYQNGPIDTNSTRTIIKSKRTTDAYAPICLQWQRTKHTARTCLWHDCGMVVA